MTSSIYQDEGVLRGVDRCPQCNVKSPFLQEIFAENLSYSDSGDIVWSLYKCSSCKKCTMVSSVANLVENPGRGKSWKLLVISLHPSPNQIDDELPSSAATYLKQAQEALHAPDGAAMLAGSAVDQMLKEKGLRDGTVYHRIEQAVEKGILTKDMSEWAHAVRLGSNRPRHADADNPHVSYDEAKQAIEFAAMLGRILFTLPNAIAEGKRVATVKNRK